MCTCTTGATYVIYFKNKEETEHINKGCCCKPQNSICLLKEEKDLLKGMT